jgi:hypothetical protein
MIVSNLIVWWQTFLGSLAMIGVILIAVGIMFGIVKPADAMKHVGAILGIVSVLMLAPCILLNAWSGMSLWQEIALIAIGVAVWWWWRPRRQPRNRE